MSEHTTSRPRRRVQWAAGIVLASAGLMLSGAAGAQGQMRQTDVGNGPGEASKGFFAEALDYFKQNSYYRVGVLHFHYVGDSSELKVENAQGLAAQAFGPGRSSLDGTGSSAGDKTTLGGTFGLYIPKTGHHLAMEVQLAPPLKLDFEVAGRAVDEPLAPTALNGANGERIPTGVPAIGRTIGQFKALPPNFTIVYRPWVDTWIQPYIGVGAIYLFTYDTDVNNEVIQAGGAEPILSLSKPIGCVGQVGVDFHWSENMFFSLDAKYAGCATVKARVTGTRVNSPTLSPTFGPIDTGPISSTNSFKALLYQASFGFKF